MQLTAFKCIIVVPDHSVAGKNSFDWMREEHKRRDQADVASGSTTCRRRYVVNFRHFCRFRCSCRRCRCC